jgi:BioD-like phosphotransacetylase family protein
VVVVRQGTLAVAAAVEEVLRGARFRQRKKLEKLEEVLQQHFDFETLDRELGS